MIEHEIATILRKHSFRWRFKDGLRLPEPEEIREALDKAKAELAKLPGDHESAFGHMIVRHEAGHFDVYVRMGEV